MATSSGSAASGATNDQIMEALKKMQEEQSRLMSMLSQGDRQSLLSSSGAAGSGLDVSESGLTASPGLTGTSSAMPADETTERDGASPSTSGTKSNFTSRIVLT